MQRNQCKTNGVEISYLDSAPDAAARLAVLLLHGFPDSAEMWTAQIIALHAAGYRVLAPDARGYGQSQLTTRVEDSALEQIVADLCGLLDALDIESAHVAGHDWGAVFAWGMAAQQPKRVRRLAALSVGHPLAYTQAGIEQKLRAWYAVGFLVPGLAERLLPVGNWRLLRSGFTGHPTPDAVRDQMARPGRLTAALNVYRANAPLLMRHGLPSVQADTLGIYSTGDAFLTARQMRDSHRFVRGQWRYEQLPGGHWMPLSQPDRISELLLEHFSA